MDFYPVIIIGALEKKIQYKDISWIYNDCNQVEHGLIAFFHYLNNFYFLSGTKAKKES